MGVGERFFYSKEAYIGFFGLFWILFSGFGFFNAATWQGRGSFLVAGSFISTFVFRLAALGTRFYYTAQAVLELMILLCQPLKPWDYRHVIEPHVKYTQILSFTTVLSGSYPLLVTSSDVTIVQSNFENAYSQISKSIKQLSLDCLSSVLAKYGWSCCIWLLFRCCGKMPWGKLWTWRMSLY